MRQFLVVLLVITFSLPWILPTLTMGGSAEYIEVTAQGSESTDVPVVTTENATGVSGITATLNGEVTDAKGGVIEERGFDWGTETGNYTYSWTESGVFGETTFSNTRSDFDPNVTIYFRAKARNSTGWGYGSELTFGTEFLGPPTNFDAVKTNNNLVTITWTMGIGTTNTYIVRKIGSYPSNRTDGALVYFGSDDNCTDTGVDFGYIASGGYYYRAWGEKDGDYSSSYAQDFLGGEGMLIMSLILFCGLLTGLSGWKRFLPLAMAASIAWLAFGILAITSPETIGVGSISEAWVQAMGFALVLMIFVPILLYIKPTTTMNKTRNGISWTEQGGIPKDKTSRREQVQRDYREQLRGKWGGSQTVRKRK